MSDETRGQSIRNRRLAIGIRSVREFADATGVSRNAVTAAEDDTASDGTYQRLESWLDRIEEETGMDAPPPPAHDTVTFQARGVFGVAEVTVAGPVENADELAQQFADLIAKLAREASQ